VAGTGVAPAAVVSAAGVGTGVRLPEGMTVVDSAAGEVCCPTLGGTGQHAVVESANHSARCSSRGPAAFVVTVNVSLNGAVWGEQLERVQLRASTTAV
jgi:hypothetical protein